MTDHMCSGCNMMNCPCESNCECGEICQCVAKDITSSPLLDDQQVTDDRVADVTLYVSGMTCTMCTASVKKCLEMLEFVEKANVSLATNSVDIWLELQSRGDNDLDSKAGLMSEELGDVGYDVTNVVYNKGKQLTEEQIEQDGNPHQTEIPMAVTIPDDQGKDDDEAEIFQRQQKLELRMKRKYFLLSLIGTFPIVFLTMVIEHVPVRNYLKETMITSGLSAETLVLWVLATFVQFYCGSVFYKSSYFSIKKGVYGMDVLVALGTTAAYIYGVIQIGRAISSKEQNHGAKFFETSSVLITFVFLGQWLQTKAVYRTSNAIKNLMMLQSKTATLVMPVVTDNISAEFDPTVQPYNEQEVTIDQVKEGNLLKIVRGAKIPTDGILVHGELYVDESCMTGESVPILKEEGRKVLGGTLNTEGVGFINVTHTGKNTVLSQITKLVRDAQMQTVPIQEFADKVSSVFVPVVVTISIATFVIWYALSLTKVVPLSWYEKEYSSGLTFSLLFAISVLVISCPCALGLATPTAVMVGTGIGAANGILFKGGASLERAHEVDTFVFDKTGTLTIGRPSVLDFILLSAASSNEFKDYSEEKLLLLFASLERNSEHPLAAAVVRYTLFKYPEMTHESLMHPQDFGAITGKGASATIGDNVISIGNRRFAAMKGIEVPYEAEETMQHLEHEGKTAVFAAVDETIVAVFGIADQIRPETKATLKAFQEYKLGDKSVEIWMVTGDNKRTAAAIGAKLGIHPSRIVAEALPVTKVKKVQELQDGGKHVVAMVGDGINDSPALAQADVGIAIGSGGEIAAEAADMVLVKNQIFDVYVAFHLANVIFHRIRLNFVWAFIYNILGIPIAAGVFYPFLRWSLSPMLAAIAMALSSISVVTSSLSLKLYEPPLMQKQPVV